MRAAYPQINAMMKQAIATIAVMVRTWFHITHSLR
ncbi:hypothetical protein MPLB_640048 [Mesorhizobium sp. ORS 3324]|nr:hypothetical protein MPLB_640048 [Mesorhizobium sp. ORS 3324]